MTADELFMTRAIELARLGIGRVSPNPRVGCVIVYNNKIIGEGWHEVYGGPHAEVNAIHSVADQKLLHDATVYVNLEPCSHFGKTPPCADLLISKSVKRVVVANEDPNPVVSGRGLKKLQDAGIEIATGILRNEGRELNRSFFTSIERQRPYIILKWAQSSDGFMAGKSSQRLWISNVYSRQLVHRWRREEDAVLVGSRTAELDNPKLNVKNWSGRNPIRIVIDRLLKLPNSLALWNKSAPTLCYNTIKDQKIDNVEFIKLNDTEFPSGIVKDLFKRNIQSVIVEGGSITLQLFLDTGLWDEARVFSSPQSLWEGIPAPLVLGVQSETQHLFSDELKIINRGKN